MDIENLKEIAEDHNIYIATSQDIIDQTINQIYQIYGDDPQNIKNNYDEIVVNGENYAYSVYLESQLNYGKEVISTFVQDLIEENQITSISEIPSMIGDYFEAFDSFFLSLSQSRKTRAGSTFESIHNTLFQRLGYPFAYQQIINGKPDFVMPSVEYFRRNPSDCIIFTSKRTLRERWRQIISEGARGSHFFLATIDDSITTSTFREMRDNRVNIVCPEEIIRNNYQNEDNVYSFHDFFTDHLDPALTRWSRNGII